MSPDEISALVNFLKTVIYPNAHIVVACAVMAKILVI